MRSLLQELVWWLLDIPVFKTVLHSIAKQDELHTTVLVERAVRVKFGDALTSGPFKGLVYPKLKHHGDQILASKYLGTFERELFPVFSEIVNRTYTVVHNIGSADGYYSVGMAMLGVAPKVVAWEMLPEMQHTTQEVAKANGLANKIEIRGLCEPALLEKEKNQGGTLIIADCEGAEDSLIAPKILEGLAPFDILVECHDLFSAGVTNKIIERFSNTHDIVQIWTKLRTLDDVPVEILANLNFPKIQIARAIEEPRLYHQSWLWMLHRA